MKKIAIVVKENFQDERKKDLIDNIEYWCDKRQLKYKIMTPSEATKLDVKDYYFIYSPLIGTANEFSDLVDLPTEIPLLMDVVFVSMEENIFKDHRIAIRSAFGNNVSPLTPGQIIPMLPRPIKPLVPENLKDVIVFDTKPFHSADTHFYILSLLAQLSREWSSLERIAGHKLFLYFTSFMKLEPYIEVYEKMKMNSQFASVNDNLFDILKQKIIETQTTMGDYQTILHRARLFVTEHGDMADTDLSQALCLGLPILTYKRFPFGQSNGIQHSRIDALKILEPEIEEKMNFANIFRMREEWGLANIISINSVPKWDFSAYEDMFLNSFDIVLEWAENGYSNNELTIAMQGGTWNAGVVIDNINYNNSLSKIKELAGKSY